MNKAKHTKLFDEDIPKTELPKLNEMTLKESTNRLAAKNKEATDPAATKNALQCACHTTLNNRQYWATTKAAPTRTAMRRPFTQ